MWNPLWGPKDLGETHTPKVEYASHITKFGPYKLKTHELWLVDIFWHYPQKDALIKACGCKIRPNKK